MSEDRLHRIEALLAEFRDAMASRADLGEAIAEVAKNVEITALGRQVERVAAETRAMRADVGLLTSIANGIASAVQALVDHQMQLAERVHNLEDNQP